MDLKVKFAPLVVAASALAIAVPAVAHGGPATHPAKSHKCAAHKVAYIESGVVDNVTSLTQNADGTWSGTLAVHVKRTNHFARADKGKTVTYTFTNAKLKVKFHGGLTAIAAGDRIKLIGKLEVVAKKCTPPANAAPVFRMLLVWPPATS